MSHSISQQKAPRRGSVLFELALVIPVLLLIFSAAIEFTNVLRVHQELNSVTRESAISLFRECAKKPTLAELNACTTPLVATLQTALTPTLNNVRLVVTWRRYDPVVVPNCFLYAGPYEAGPSGGASRINPVVMSYDAYCQEQQQLLNVEAFVQYSPVTGSLANLFGFGSREFYAVVTV